jgi:chromosome partitioning protein
MAAIISKIIAVANQKGGVGKTTTATNLGAGLAIRGFRTLLIDLDPQCNATYTYLDADIIKETLANVLIGNEQRIPLIDAVYETHIENFHIVPAHIRLAVLEQQVRLEEQYRLRDAIYQLTGYDFIILDCPHTLGVTITQAFLAATHIIVPITAEYYSLDGVIDLSQTIEVAKRPNPGLRVLGYLITRFDTRTTISHSVLDKVQEMFPGDVFETVIRANTKLQSAPAYRKSIYEHAPSSAGANDYDALIDEALERLQINQNLHLVTEAING